MTFKKSALLALCVLGFHAAAHANEVLIKVNKPAKVVFKEAHRNENGVAVYGAPTTVNIQKSMPVSIDLNGYDHAGLSIVSIDGHELPPDVTQFDKPKQCSISTNKTRTNGEIELDYKEHSISCKVGYHD